MAKEIEFHKKICMEMKNCSTNALEKYNDGEDILSTTAKITFKSNVTEWYLKIIPNNTMYNLQYGIGLYLKWKHSNAIKNVTVKTMGILGRNKSLIREGSEAKVDEFSVGYDQLILHDFLFKRSEELIIGGRLTFFCYFVFTLTVDRTSANKHQNLTNDFKKMFNEGLFTDFELKTKDGMKLKAHKVVLIARSPVFEKMLQHDMKEANEGITDVPDFDSVVMKEVLRYMYCNEIRGVEKIAHELVYAAEKYQLEDLKETCIEKISYSLSAKNVLKSLLIAYQVSNPGNLFRECVGVITRDFEAINGTEEWKNLFMEHPEIAMKMTGEMSRQFIPDYNFKHDSIYVTCDRQSNCF